MLVFETRADSALSELMPFQGLLEEEEAKSTADWGGSYTPGSEGMNGGSSRESGVVESA